MGNYVLNILSEGHGFFWWGGDGIATEHTAYLRLKEGMKAPLSGAWQTNGKVMAEQIGGQIFSDCWGQMCIRDRSIIHKQDLEACVDLLTYILCTMDQQTFDMICAQ